LTAVTYAIMPLSAREYHLKREEERRQESESRRQTRLDEVRAAILAIAPGYPEIQAVYLFGSIVQPGRFGRDSDIDVALVCDEVAVESWFWRVLEETLQWQVDVRPLTGAVATAVTLYGEQVYAREDDST
jgi:predicted nucleotidyltransferase